MANQNSSNNQSTHKRFNPMIIAGIAAAIAIGLFALWALSSVILALIKVVCIAAVFYGAYRLAFGAEFQSMRDHFKAREIGAGFRELFSVIGQTVIKGLQAVKGIVINGVMALAQPGFFQHAGEQIHHFFTSAKTTGQNSTAQSAEHAKSPTVTPVSSPKSSTRHKL
jgi:hypothetical protein